MSEVTDRYGCTFQFILFVSRIQITITFRIFV
jgi:hypothetical protein